jgi:imidazolonepropionase-like amidohydrolase
MVSWIDGPSGRTTASLCVLALFLAHCTPTPPAGEDLATDRAVAFVGVNVVPMDEEQVLRDQTVVVREGRIETVGPAGSSSIPPDALEVPGAGRYLIPGLAEMHGHIPSPDSPPEFVENVLFLYVANGITTVRGMLGHPGQLDLRERARRGEIVAPHLYLAGPGFSGNTINSPEEAVERVRRQKAEGWDLLKVYPGLTREEFDAMAQTAREEGIRFAGHVPADVGLLHAIEMGQETFDHLDGYIEALDGDAGPLDEARLADLVRRTREAGAWVVPTMALWETLLGAADLETLRSYPELRYMPPDQVEAWTTSHENRLANPDLNLERSRRIIDNRTHVLRALHEGGALILMGTDAPQQFSVPGFSLHRELERMEAAGMSPYEILRTGTYNVGLYFRDHDDFGTIAPCKRADLVLLEENPLDDLGALRQRAGVMVNGRWLPESAIQDRLQRIEASYADPS